MWTANILKIEKATDTAVVLVEVSFTKGQEYKAFTYRVSDPSTIKRVIKDQVDQLNRIDDFVSSPDLEIGPVIFDEAPIIVVTLPPVDLVKQAFADDFITLRKMNSAIKFGLKSETDKDYQDILTKLKSNFSLDSLPIF